MIYIYILSNFCILIIIQNIYNFKMYLKYILNIFIKI